MTARTFAALGLLLIAPLAAAENPQVRLTTNLGEIVVELNADKAPKSVDNFVRYVKSGFYDGTVFHRVIPGFMVQGGGFTKDLRQKDTRPPVQNEADNGLKNERGTIAMARTNDPNSATAQFFINHNNNDFLNHRGKSLQGWGYAVFGKVVKGIDVVDKIAAIPTGPGGPFPSDVPQQPATIEKAEVVSTGAKPQ